MLKNKCSKLAVAFFLAASLVACVPAYQQKGYASEADYEFSKSLGSSTPKRVQGLRSYGITSRQQLDEVIAEMNKINYSQNNDDWGTIFNYLSDRQKSKDNNISIMKQKKQREAKEAIEEAKREATIKKERQEFAKNFPYTATFSCSYGNQLAALEACFIGSHNLKTQIEIRNGSKYGFYQPWELEKLGSKSTEGVVVPLSKDFTIKAQNANSSLTLNLVIREYISGRIVWQKSVGEFGVILIRN